MHYVIKTVTKYDYTEETSEPHECVPPDNWLAIVNHIKYSYIIPICF